MSIVWLNKLKNSFKRTIDFYMQSISDEQYILTDMKCWRLFPPSFYKTHSAEEIREAEAKAIERINKLILELKEDEYSEHKEKSSNAKSQQ